jgi:hypothetical protein
VWDLLDSEDHDLSLGVHHYHASRLKATAPPLALARRQWAAAHGFVWTPANTCVARNVMGVYFNLFFYY